LKKNKQLYGKSKYVIIAKYVGGQSVYEPTASVHICLKVRFLAIRLSIYGKSSPLSLPIIILATYQSNYGRFSYVH
jgi:hypothetical protein